MDLDLQFFAEEGLEKQSIAELEKGIRSLKERITEHKKKIQNPKQSWVRWDEFDETRKQRELKHWRKEIMNFEESINNREEELKKRGEII